MLETNEGLTLDGLTETDKQKLLFEQQKKHLICFLNAEQ